MDTLRTATDGCAEAPQRMVADAPATTEGPLLERIRELETALADATLQSSKRENVFRETVNTERQRRDQMLESREDHIARLHNRTITLESTLKTIRRLTNDPEVATIIRLALVGIYQE